MACFKKTKEPSTDTVGNRFGLGGRVIGGLGETGQELGKRGA